MEDGAYLEDVGFWGRTLLATPYAWVFSSLSLLPVCHRASCFPLPYCCHYACCHSRSPATATADHGLKPLKLGAKISPSFFKWFISGLRHSGEKLTDPPPITYNQFLEKLSVTQS